MNPMIIAGEFCDYEACTEEPVFMDGETGYFYCADHAPEIDAAGINMLRLSDQ